MNDDRKKAKSKRELITEVQTEFDRQFASLNDGSMRKKVEQIMRSRGRLKVRPKAGPSF